MFREKLNRRNFLAAGPAVLAASACSRQRAARYSGWLLVASGADKSVNVADLSEFRRVTSVSLAETPGQILKAGNRVFVTCPEARTLVQIDPVRFSIVARIPVPGRTVSATVTEGGLIVLATAQPAMLLVVDPATRHISRRFPLEGDPSVFDLAGDLVALQAAGQVVRMSLRDGRVAGRTSLGEPCDSLRFRRDGRLILLGLPRSRQIVSLDAQSGRVLARLPLRFAPGRFCFNADGGQMFVTATGEDLLAIVSPFQSQIDQTIVGGRLPYGMAVSTTRNLLLVTNPPSGDLTILDIESRHLMASVHVGGEPTEVLLTPPDEDYALVVNRDGGDVAVIRMQTALDKSVRVKPLLTMLPMGGDPRSALVVPRES